MKRVAAIALVAGAAWLALAGDAAVGDAPPLPPTLAATGLYVDGSTTEVRPGTVAFAPQYPLWSDGAAKRRWIRLPAGTSIDATDVDAWDFPRGTRLWKEFAQGRRVETRMIERLADGNWRYATYVWNADGTEATLAPERGARVDVASAPGGRYAVPSRVDCVACHEGAAVPVLGFGALQLSADRDPLAPHAEAGALDLGALVERGLVRGLPREVLAEPPRIPASAPVERAALGYLHANCGHCHNAGWALDGVEMTLAQRVAHPQASVERTLASLVGRVGRYRSREAQDAARVVAGHPGASVLARRLASSDPLVRMPPLGVRVVDDEGVALVQRWILSLTEEKKP